MKYEWQDLPKIMNCFTVRNAVMINLNTGKPVQHYSANTKIRIAQKCVTPEKTYYRTGSAAYNYLNYAFEASAFGLPDEKAPLEHSSLTFSSLSNIPEKRTKKPVKKQTSSQKRPSAKSGERRSQGHWLSKLFRRKNG